MRIRPRIFEQPTQLKDLMQILDSNTRNSENENSNIFNP